MSFEPKLGGLVVLSAVSFLLAFPLQFVRFPPTIPIIGNCVEWLHLPRLYSHRIATVSFFHPLVQILILLASLAQSRDQVWGLYHHNMDTKYGGQSSSSMDDSRVGNVASNSDVLETRGRSALELATSSRCVRALPPSSYSS